MPETASLEHFEPMSADNPEDSSEVPVLPLTDQSGVEEQPSDPPPPSSPEPSLPPEAQGEVNGGPLGCCLGVTLGLVAALSVGVIGRLYANDLLPALHNALLILVLIRIAMAICGIAAMIIFGYFGWKIGKRIYREYDSPVVKDKRHQSKPKPRRV